MRALRFHTARDLRIEEVAPPSSPGVGEVVVRVASCGICGTDLHEYVAGPIVTPVEPHPLTGAQNPQILGHEFAGDVVAVGPGVTRVGEGSRRDHAWPTAATAPIAGEGCSTCARRWHASGSHAWGGMAELATVANIRSGSEA
jgi:(R,R)-butanediol dehydrogenase/meso-butanediol dehydrogenase/diacetyl reductase